MSSKALVNSLVLSILSKGGGQAQLHSENKRDEAITGKALFQVDGFLILPEDHGLKGSGDGVGVF